MISVDAGKRRLRRQSGLENYGLAGLGLLFIFVLTEVFSGVLRYYLSLASVPWLIYLPKALIAVAFVGLLLKTAYLGCVNRAMLMALVLFGTYWLVGVVMTQSWVQPTFGLFVLSPFLFALLVEPDVSRLGDRLVPYIAVVWLAAAGGVVFSYLSDVPWSGAAYQLGDYTIEGSREWWAFGITRVAGFSRASFEVAGQLLFLAIPLVILGRSKVLGAVVWLATGVLIVLTTTKKTVGVYLLLTVLLPLMLGRLTPAVLKHSIAKIVPIIVAAIGIALPLSTLFFDYKLGLGNYVSQFLFASFEERLTWAWPEGIALVADHGNLIAGRGIGGIGVAQLYFEPEHYTFADNLYLYLYATFGAVAFVLVWVYVAAMSKMDTVSDGWGKLIWFWSVSILTGGWAANGVESAFTSLLLGITFGYAFRNRRLIRAPKFAWSRRAAGVQ